MGLEKRDFAMILVGILIGVIVAYFLNMGIMNFSEGFANKKAMAQEINNKVGGMFNDRKEDYGEICKQIDYYDAVMYSKMKKIRNKQGYVDEASIAKIL